MTASATTYASDDGTDDGVLVASALDGDRDAFRLLVRRHQDALYRYAVRMTGHGDVAADLVQATFVKAYTRLDRCRNPDRFGAWIFQIVANACRDHFRRQRRRRKVSIDDHDGGGPAPAPALTSASDPALDLERAELRDRIERAIGRLPDEQREAFLLKHVELRSYPEMSEILDVSVSALKMRVHRAREALKAELEEVVR
ncbi:MAG: RNA polymerase sigma factor [Gemmatimonadota bacterium]